jgi:hypothetical protein
MIKFCGDVAYVPLTKGYKAIIDLADVPLVEGYKWRAHLDKRSDGSVRRVYAYSQNIQMHRLINNTPEGLHTDHIDGNGLNNRRINLRTATCSENSYNQGIRINNTSGIKGVHWDKEKSKWRVRIRVGNGKRIQLGRYSSIEEATEVYNKAVVKYHGDFGRLQ